MAKNRTDKKESKSKSKSNLNKCFKCKSKCSCLLINHVVLSCIINPDGFPEFTIKLEIKNNCKKNLHHFFIRDALLNSVGNGKLKSIEVIPFKSSLVPVSRTTLPEIKASGNLIDYKISTFKGCRKTTIIYTGVWTANITCALNSCITLGYSNYNLATSNIPIKLC